MSDLLNRREVFQIVGATLLAADILAAQQATQSLNGGPNYVPKHFNQQHFKTMRHLGDLIMPADATSPAASEAGAAEFIDFLCSRNEDLAAIFDGGLAWLDEYMIHKHGTDFLTSKPAEQSALLDLAYGTRGGSPETAGGTQFFMWARNMVVDAYYTSPVGVKDIGYMGNTVVGTFSVPKEAVDYALKRSPFGA